MSDSNAKEPSENGVPQPGGATQSAGSLAQERAEAIHQLALDTRAAIEKAEMAVKKHLSRRGRFGLRTST
jgi:hypothetical protein